MNSRFVVAAADTAAEVGSHLKAGSIETRTNLCRIVEIVVVAVVAAAAGMN